MTSDAGADESGEPDTDAPEREVETSDETDAAPKTGVSDKKKKNQRLARLRRRSIAVRAYDFVGQAHDLSGIIFMEIQKVTDLPPERNSMCIFLKNTFPTDYTSDADHFRYGSFRCGIAWTKDPADQSGQS